MKREAKSMYIVSCLVYMQPWNSHLSIQNVFYIWVRYLWIEFADKAVRAVLKGIYGYYFWKRFLCDA